MASRYERPEHQKSSAERGARKRESGTAIERMERGGGRLSDVDTKVVFKLTGQTDQDEDLEALYGSSRCALTAARQAISEFRSLYTQGLQRWELDRETAGALAIATGKRGMSEALLLSNGKVRLEATSIMTDVIKAFWAKTRYIRGRKWWLITFVSDCGNALEYRPVVNTESFRRKVYRMLHKVDLDAFQALTNFPNNGDGRSLMFHAHALAWTDDPDFDEAALERQLCASGSMRHWLGAKTVRITEIPPTERHIKWRCHYLLKAPFVGNYLKRSNETPSGYDLANAKVRSDLAVRLLECLTQLEITQMVWGIRGGKALTREWRRRLKQWHARQCRRPGRTLAKDYDIAGLWKNVRRSRRNNKHKPFRFIPKRSERGPTEWEIAAKASMEAKVARARKADS